MADADEQPGRRPLDPQRLRRARRLAELAWADLPPEHRRLLENIGAAQREVVDRPLGAYVDELLTSSGRSGIGAARRADLNHALGVWIGALRVVVIDAGHLALRGLDESSYEAMVVRTAWHEWGHALSLARAMPADVAAGTRLLSLAPDGIAEGIRTEGYRPRDYVHEILAETYALLMARRRRGETKQPIWLGWRDLRAGETSMRMERVEPTTAYVVRDRERVKKILSVEAELLRSEGIDPAWPGFPEREAGLERVPRATTPAVDDPGDPSPLTCFVIGPIGNRLAPFGSGDLETYEESLRVMAEVIEPACKHLGLDPVRADSLGRAGEITDQIFRRLHEDDVVIADLTDANPNVMYELGLRHTRDKLTVQIGEFGRLPFDVSTIRTIQFSRSPIGLINARNELMLVLEAGLGGEFDPVSATRIWNADGLIRDTIDASAETALAGDDEDERGFMDIVAEAEEQIEVLPPALESIGAVIVELGNLAEQTVEQMARSDAAGQGMRGRLRVAATHAEGLTRHAEDLEVKVDHYVSVLDAVSAGTLALIQNMSEDADALEEGREFGMTTRGLAAATRISTLALTEFVGAIKASASMSRVLREPSRRLTAALGRFVNATSIIDEWDRRLQSLGIPVPVDGDESELERLNIAETASPDQASHADPASLEASP